MNKLWVFGDSQTFGHGCRPDGPLTEYYYNYKKDGDKTWPDLLGDKLGFEVVNCGKCGASNDDIFDIMIKNFNNIKEGDYVILGKTAHYRFDVRDFRSNTLFNVIGEVNIAQTKKEYQYWLDTIKRTRDEIENLVFFTSTFATDTLFKQRQDLRFDFIKDRLFEKKIGFFYEWEFETPPILPFGRIKGDTNNKIKDNHFSFKGHRQMYNYLCQIIPLNQIHDRLI